MAVSILDIPNRNGDLGTRMGQGFSSGVQNGLQQLLEWKMKEYTDKQKAGRKEEAFKTVPGMTPEQAKAWGSVDDTGLQQLFLKQQLQSRDPSRMAFAQGVASLAQPGQQGQEQGLQQLLGQMNPRDALALMTFQQGQINKQIEQEQKTQQLQQNQQKINQSANKETNRAATAKQNKLDDTAAPLMKQYKALSDTANTTLPKLHKLLDLVKSGKINRGLWGLGESAESKIYKDTVDQIIADGAVHGNKTLMELGEQLKGDLGNKALESRLRYVIKEYSEGSLYNRAANDVIEENGGEIPASFEKLVERKVQSYKKNGIPEKEEQGNQPALAPMDQPFSLQPLDDEQTPPVQGQPIAQQLAEPTQTQQLTGLPTLQQMSDMGFDQGEGAGLNPAYLAARGAKGLASGVTGLAALPFNAASAISGGRIPVPGIIEGLEGLPEKGFNALPESIKNAQGGEWLGDVTEDAFSMLAPSGLLGAVGKGAKLLGKASPWIDKAAKFLKVTPAAALKSASVGNAASWVAKKAGANENEAGVVKMGAMVATALLDAKKVGGTVKQIAGAIDQRPKPSIVIKRNAPLYEQSNNLFKAVQNVAESPEKTELMNQLSNVYGSQADFNDVWNLKKAVDGAFKNKDLRAAMKKVPKFATAMDETLLSSSQSFPQLHNRVNQYLDLNNAANTQSVLQDFAGNLTKYRPTLPESAAGLGSLSWLNRLIPGIYKPLAITGAALLPAGEVEKVGRMVLKSPLFRQLYGQYVNAALAGNVKEGSKILSAISKQMMGAR